VRFVFAKPPSEALQTGLANMVDAYNEENSPKGLSIALEKGDSSRVFTLKTPLGAEAKIDEMLREMLAHSASMPSAPEPQLEPPSQTPPPPASPTKTR
jgi:hypothetical protein